MSISFSPGNAGTTDWNTFKRKEEAGAHTTMQAKSRGKWTYPTHWGRPHRGLRALDTIPWDVPRDRLSPWSSLVCGADNERIAYEPGSGVA